MPCRHHTLVAWLCIVFWAVEASGGRLRLRGGAATSAPYRDSSYDRGYGLDDGYSGKDMNSGLGHLDWFDKSVCKFGDSAEDAKNIFDIGHKLAASHRYRDSADCFKAGINSWWKIVRHANPIAKKISGTFQPASPGAIHSLEKHLSHMYKRQQIRTDMKKKDYGNTELNDNKNQVPPQLTWLHQQKASDAGM